jgi:hypothetical protein
MSTPELFDKWLEDGGFSPHHHRDRDSMRIDEQAWRTLRARGDNYCLLARYPRATETITALWHGDGESYDFAVHIVGGKHHGVVIQCRTRHSVMALFDLIVACRKQNRELSWLAPLHEIHEYKMPEAS